MQNVSEYMLVLAVCLVLLLSSDQKSLIYRAPLQIILILKSEYFALVDCVISVMLDGVCR